MTAFGVGVYKLIYQKLNLNHQQNVYMNKY